MFAMKSILKLNAISDQYKHVTDELKQVKAAMQSGDNTLSAAPRLTLTTFKCKAFLPLKTIGELHAFEATFNDAVLADVTAYLMSIGGNSEERCIAGAAAAVYALELQIATTWKGKKSADGWAKDPLDSTELPYIIADVVRSAYPHRTTAHLIRAFRAYMLHGSDRAKKSKI